MKGIWKRTKFWCDTCDCNHVALGKKCEVCGIKNNPEKGRIKHCDEIKKDLQADGISDINPS